MAQKRILVYADWLEKTPLLIGSLYVAAGKRETFSFEFTADFLTNYDNIWLDPDLSWYSGRQYTADGHLFGLLADSSPDRWGRMLMQRRETMTAQRQSRKPRKLYDSDFLLGVHDEGRMGGLRLSLQENGPFLDNDNELATPPWVNLRELETASLALEDDSNRSHAKWLNILLAPGSSLGGARPKATVKDRNDDLWIAKFPSRNDTVDVGAWEMVAHDLAEKCGLNVPAAKLEKFSSLGSTFLTKRFDRCKERRIHMASAMTMLGKRDNAPDASYLDIAEFVRSHSSHPAEDLEELWKRIVFNMLISNTDDHLRNHGFLLTAMGWRLSPLYDVNPIPYGEELSLSIANEDSALSLDLALDTASLYGVRQEKATHIIKTMQTIIASSWDKLAGKYKIGAASVKYMKSAFSLALKS